MSIQITKEAREAANNERLDFDYALQNPVPYTLGTHVQALLDARDQRHAEEVAKLKERNASGHEELKNTISDWHSECDELREQLRAKDKETIEWHMAATKCGLYRGDTDVSTADKWLSAQLNAASALLSDNDRLKAEVQRLTELVQRLTELVGRYLKRAAADAGARD